MNSERHILYRRLMDRIVYCWNACRENGASQKQTSKSEQRTSP